jgi:transcription termination factor NusB
MRCLESAEKMMAVFNATQNSNIRQTAKADADYFYGVVRKMQKETSQSKTEIDKNFDKWSEDYMKAWGGK